MPGFEQAWTQASPVGGWLTRDQDKALWLDAKLSSNGANQMKKSSLLLDIFTRGPMISRFSFTIDVREWGFADPRSELVKEVRNKPEVRAIAEADVWDERGEERVETREEAAAEPPAAVGTGRAG